MDILIINCLIKVFKDYFYERSDYLYLQMLDVLSS